MADREEEEKKNRRASAAIYLSKAEQYAKNKLHTLNLLYIYVHISVRSLFLRLFTSSI